MKGGCDYSALAKVDAQLQELLNGRLDAIIDEKSSEAAAALLSKLKKRTPVGKAPHFDEPMTVTIKGDDYTTQTVNKKGEQVFRKRKGKTYRFRSKSGSIFGASLTKRPEMTMSSPPRTRRNTPPMWSTATARRRAGMYPRWASG